MSRVRILPALAVAALLVAAPCIEPRAQTPADDNMRIEATATLSKLVDATNRGDAKLVRSLFSTAPEACVIADGEIYQGSGEIDAHVDRLLGQAGRYVFELGTMSIASLHGTVLAAGPYTLRDGDARREPAYRGAITIVLEKSGRRRWLVAHLHRSIAFSRPD